MPKGGRIVNIGSIVSRMSTLPAVSVYGASKAAQEYLTGALATEVGPESYRDLHIGQPITEV